MAVADVFPVTPSFPVLIKPKQIVLVSEPDSPKEQRLLKWSQRRKEVMVSLKALTDSDLATLDAFHTARNGAFDVFSFLPPINHGRLRTSVPCGTGNGSTTVFYLDNSQTPAFYTRLYLGAGNRNKVYLDGANQASGWTLANDDANFRSTVTFTVAPANGKVVTVDVDRYLIVRFEQDAYEAALTAYAIGEVETLRMIEVLRNSI